MTWLAWLLVGLAFAYLAIGAGVAVLVSRTSRPAGAWWAVLFWPLWAVPRSV